MSWRITRKKMLAAIAVLFLALVAFGVWGCSNLTRAEEKKIKDTAGQVGGMFGLPPYVGESIAGLFLTIAASVEGHRRGRRRERRCQAPPKGTA
jgi:hypothetical protein